MFWYENQRFFCLYAWRGSLGILALISQIKASSIGVNGTQQIGNRLLATASQYKIYRGARATWCGTFPKRGKLFCFLKKYVSIKIFKNNNENF